MGKARSSGRGGRPWAYVTLVAALAALVAVFVLGSGALAHSGVLRSVYYLVLLAAGLAVAAFLDQALRASDAEWVGQFWFGKVRLGGAVAVFGLVVAAGMYLTGGAAAVELLVRAVPAVDDPEALQGGTARLVLGKYDVEQHLSRAGEADFRDLSERLRGQAGYAAVSVPGYEPVRVPLAGLPRGEVLEVPIVRTTPRSALTGTVLTARGAPLPGVLIDIEHGLIQVRTDALGHFHAEIPRERGAQVLLMAVHDGKVGHAGYVTVPGELTFQFEGE